MIKLITSSIFLATLTAPAYATNVEIPQTATPIFVGDAQAITDSFQIGSTAEQDWFVFYSEGKLLQIKIPDDSVTPTIDPQLELFDEQGAKLFNRPENSGNQGEGERLEVIYDPGFYFIRVTNLFNGSGSYQLRVFRPILEEGGGLKGNIIDQCTKNGISKAAITINGVSTMSHTTGAFGVAFISSGSQMLSIRKDGYKTAQLIVDIIDENVINTTAELVPDDGCVSTPPVEPPVEPPVDLPAEPPVEPRSTTPNPVSITNQFTGSWYDPSHNGEGYAIEILANGQAHVTWYTYDKNGQQAWIVGVGTVNGNTINVTETITTRGGVFGEAFNSDDVVREAWGSILFIFNDCNHTTVNYAGPVTFGSGTLNLERLTSISGLDCTQPSTDDPSITLGKITGTWYDPDHDGEGYVIEILNNDQAVVFWYTYDENGNQTWITGDGQVQGHSIVINNTIFTEGGIFGAEFNPDSVQRKNWGQITFDFSSCNTGVVNYESTAGFGSGQLNLVRLTSIDDYACDILP